MDSKLTCTTINSSTNGSVAQFSLAADPVKDATGKEVPQRPKLVVTVAFSDNSEAIKFQPGKEYAISISAQ